MYLTWTECNYIIDNKTNLFLRFMHQKLIFDIFFYPIFTFFAKNIRFMVILKTSYYKKYYLVWMHNILRNRLHHCQFEILIKKIGSN